MEVVMIVALLVVGVVGVAEAVMNGIARIFKK